jgi:hypothetical protein
MTGHDKIPRGIHLFPALSTLVLVGLALYASGRLGQPGSATAKPAQDNDPAQVTKEVAAGKKFLDSLDENQRAKALLEFDSKKKAGWSNLPVTFVPRNGVRLGDLTPAQRDAAMGLLKAVLSPAGYQKVIDIMNADQVLADKGGGKGGKGGGKGGKKGPAFGNDNYYLAVFGTPSPTRPWFVQFGGHHLGVNVTLVGKASVLTPTHTGTQPESFTRDGKKVRPLGGEDDKAFQLVNSLNEKQKAQAVLSNQPQSNLILGPGQDGKTINPPQGVKGSALTPEQKGILLDLIGQWVHILPDGAAADRMVQIKAKLDDTYFAWQGPTKNGSAAYFRVQGPTVVIEYAPQGSRDHIHTVIRDPTNDYGQKLLQR